MGNTRSIHFPDDDEELEEWIERRVEKGLFNNFSHGVRYCIQNTMKENVEEMV